MKISKTNWIIIFSVLAVGSLAVGTVSSVSSCCGRSEARPVLQRPIVYSRPAPMVVARPAPVVITQPVAYSAPVVSAPCAACQPRTVSRPAPCSACRVNKPAFKTVRETVMKEEEVTTYETVWDEETRYRTKTVCRQVPETSVKQETVKVSRPVWETVEKETSYDVVRYVQETSEREEVSTVCRPVTEYQERKIVEKVNRPVQETIMTERTSQVNRPVTTLQTQTREVGEYVTHYAPQAPREYTRLTWQKGGEYFDPATGKTKRRLPGLYWTDMTGPTQYKAESVYEPRQITETVPVTTYVPETVTETVPVTVNKVIQEEVVRTEQVPVTRMVKEQVVKKVPVTTYKPVTEKVVEKVPVKVCRMETVDEVRETPVTTYKTVTETVQEPYTVRVARQVPKTVKVQKPVTVCKQVPCDAEIPVAANACSATAIPSDIPAPVTEAEPAPVTEAEPAKESDSIPTIDSSVSKPATDGAADQSGKTESSVNVRYPGPIQVKNEGEKEVITTDEPVSSDLPAVHQSVEAKKNGTISEDKEIMTESSPQSIAPPLTDADQKPELQENKGTDQDTSASSQETALPHPSPVKSEMKIYRPQEQPPLVPEENSSSVSEGSSSSYFTLSRPNRDINSDIQASTPAVSPTRMLK